MVVAVGDGVADTMSLTTAEVSAVAVSTAWRATTLIPSATAGCRRAMVMKSSKLFQETRRRSIDQGRRLSISGRVSLESARICYISLRVDRGLLSALGRYCSMGGSRRSDRAEQVSAVSRGIGTRRNRVNPVRCRETRHVGGRPGAEVDEVKSVEVEMDGDTEVWYGYCTVAERGSGRGQALAGKLLRHGPSRGAGAEAGPKAGGGTFLAREAGCVVCVGCVAGVQILAIQAEQRPELGAASGQSRSLCRGAVSGRATRSVKGRGCWKGGVRNGRKTAKDFSTFPTTSLHDTFPSLSASSSFSADDTV